MSQDYQVACPSRDTYVYTRAYAHARTTATPIYSTTTPNLFPVLCSNILNHHASMYLARSIASNQAYSQLLSRFRDSTAPILQVYCDPPGSRMLSSCAAYISSRAYYAVDLIGDGYFFIIWVVGVFCYCSGFTIFNY